MDRMTREQILAQKVQIIQDFLGHAAVEGVELVDPEKGRRLDAVEVLDLIHESLGVK